MHLARAADVEIEQSKRLTMRSKLVRKLGWLSLQAVTLFLVLDWLILDSWSIHGRVLDLTGAPVSDARVLVTLTGERFSPAPHSGGGGARCIRSFVTPTDHQGHFSISAIGINRIMVTKTASVDVIAPSTYQDATVFAPISASLLAMPTELLINMKPDTGVRWSFGHSGSTAPLSLDPESPDYQHTMSEALTAKANVLDAALCSYEGWPLLVSVLNEVVSKARTDDERKYIRSRCQGMQSTAEFLNRRKGERDGWIFANEPRYVMPYDCNSSLFRE
jgi:hypothetical protein